MVSQQQINEALPLVTAFVNGQDIDPALLRSSVYVLHAYAYEQQQLAAQMRQMSEDAHRRLLELRPELQNLVDDEARYRKAYEHANELCRKSEDRFEALFNIQQRQSELARIAMDRNDVLEDKLGQLQKDFAQMLEDWSEETEGIRTECKRVFSNEHVEGDSYGVPDGLTLVKWLVNALVLARNDAEFFRHQANGIE